PAEKDAVYGRSMPLREQLVATYPEVAEYRACLANGLRRYGSTLRALGRRPQAEVAFRRSIAEWESLTSKFPLLSGSLNQVATTQDEFATFLKNGGRNDEAESLYRLANDSRERLVVEFLNGEGDHIVEWSVGVCRLTDLLKNSGRQQEAEAILRKTIDRFE